MFEMRVKEPELQAESKFTAKCWAGGVREHRTNCATFCDIYCDTKISKAALKLSKMGTFEKGWCG